MQNLLPLLALKPETVVQVRSRDDRGAHKPGNSLIRMPQPSMTLDPSTLYAATGTAKLAELPACPANSAVLHS